MATNIEINVPNSSGTFTSYYPKTSYSNVDGLENYVAEKIAALVDSAPATLNTLKELATALGNDASFSTTMTNALANKLSLTGGTITGEICVKCNEFDDSNLPTSDKYRTYYFCDKNDVRLHDYLLTMGKDGTLSGHFRTWTHKDKTRIQPLGWVVSSDGSDCGVYVPTRPNNASDGYAATTAWVRTATGSTTLNSATSAKLATARTINGTSFDGSANITTTNWGTARNITIKDATSTNAGTAVSVNGSANATLLLPSTIKANLTGDCSGNAATATKATGDKNGNDITSTYLKLSGGTMTGALTTQNAFKIQNKYVNWSSNPTPTAGNLNSLYFTDVNGTLLGTLESFQVANSTRHGVKINVPSGPTNPFWQSCQMEYSENGRFKFMASSIDAYQFNNIFGDYDLVNNYTATQNNNYSSLSWRDKNENVVFEFLGFVNQVSWGGERGVIFRSFGSNKEVNHTGIFSCGVTYDDKSFARVETPDTNSTDNNQIATIGWVKNFLRSKNLIS